jgi:hypothetical protein
VGEGEGKKTVTGKIDQKRIESSAAFFEQRSIFFATQNFCGADDDSGFEVLPASTQSYF